MQDAFTTTQTMQDDGPLTDPDYSRWQTEIVAGKYSMSVSSGDRVITAGTNFCQVCKQWWTMLHNHLTHGSLDKVAATKTTLWLHFVQSSKWWVQQHCENTR